MFALFSDVNLNKNKTEGIWIEKLKNSEDKAVGMIGKINQFKHRNIFRS